MFLDMFLLYFFLQCLIYLLLLRPQEVIESLGDGFTTQPENGNVLSSPYISSHSAPH